MVRAKIGRSAVRWSRPLQGTPKTVTMRREAAGGYVTCSCAEVPRQPLPRPGEATGIDLGLEAFAPLAKGSQLAHPRRLRVAERALRRAPRRVARRTKGSHRRTKAVRVLARAQQRVRRQRTDLHHKTALALVQRYDTISQEDLPPANMVQHHHLAKSLADAGWRAFLRILSCAQQRTLGRRS